MAEQNESNNYSREEVLSLVEQFELDLREDSNIFLKHGSFIQIIEYYENEFETEKALDVAELAQKHYPFSAIFKVKAARFLDELGFHEEAEEVLEVSKILDASETEYYLLKSELLSSKGLYKEAIEVIKQGLTFADNIEKFDLFLGLSDIYESSLNHSEMLSALQEAALIIPKDFEVAERLSFAIEELEIFDKGIDIYNKILDIEPYAHYIWFNLGKCYVELGLFEKAIEAFDFALVVDEDYYDALYQKAEAYYEIELYGKALKNYKLALTLKEASPDLLYSIAFTYYHLENHASAISHFKKVIKLDPTYQDAYFQIGKIKEEHGFFDTALNYYEQAHDLETENDEYLEALGNINLKLENYESAAKYFISVLVIDPSCEANWLQLAACYNALNLDDEAIQVLEFGLNAIPESSILQIMMGIYTWEIGKQQLAIDHFRSALILDKTKGDFIFKNLPYLANNKQIQHLIQSYQ